MSTDDLPVAGFDRMNLNPAVYAAVEAAGYETPTPVQSRTIPLLAQGRDLIGQARTGTGKTAAFALPLLSRIDLEDRRPQVLVMTPTRELAIQVAESFKAYGKHLKGLGVLPVYGGQSYGVQLNQLKRGVHVVVGTPGRIMDHLKRKTLSFAGVFCTVLDEADEMLHMGFIEDVEWILGQAPDDAQSALFSATMPAPIRKIAEKYLKDPEEVSIRQETQDLGTINQQYWMAGRMGKPKALARILSALCFDGVIVFARTKNATLEVAKTLEAQGFRAEALNGDMAQNAREQTVKRLKNGQIDILVATDVAARGLDVERISHVINYDMPTKVEPYIHRIGRTGRAGRTGEAILFLNRNERWMLRAIQRQTKKEITEMSLPSNADINRTRIAAFQDRITRALLSPDLADFETVIADYATAQNVPVEKVAAALAKMAQGNAGFLIPEDRTSKKENVQGKPVQKDGESRQKAPARAAAKKAGKAGKKGGNSMAAAPLEITPPEKGMERYRIEVGSSHGLHPKDIVGAISNEAGLEGKFIGRIYIEPEYSFVELPFGMPKNTFHLLKRTWVKSRRMAISRCA